MLSSKDRAGDRCLLHRAGPGRAGLGISIAPSAVQLMRVPQVCFAETLVSEAEWAIRTRMEPVLCFLAADDQLQNNGGALDYSNDPMSKSREMCHGR